MADQTQSYVQFRCSAIDPIINPETDPKPNYEVYRTLCGLMDDALRLLDEAVTETSEHASTEELIRLGELKAYAFLGQSGLARLDTMETPGLGAIAAMCDILHGLRRAAER